MRTMFMPGVYRDQKWVLKLFEIACHYVSLTGQNILYIVEADWKHRGPSSVLGLEVDITLLYNIQTLIFFSCVNNVFMVKSQELCIKYIIYV